LTDGQIIIAVIIGGAIITLALLFGILMVWPLALVLTVAGYLIDGAQGVLGGLAIAGVFGLLLYGIGILQG